MADVAFVVKICGITNEEDARVAVHAGANALGFNFYPNSPRYVTPERAHEIAAAVSGSYLRVGVFVNPSEEEVTRTSDAVPLDVVQLHGPDCPISFSKHLRVWRAISPVETERDASTEAYLLDTPSAGYGGSGRTFDWQLARHHTGRVILAGGLDARNVSAAIETVNPWGVDACSRLESSPGKKDTQGMRDFVHAALAQLNQTKL